MHLFVELLQFHDTVLSLLQVVGQSAVLVLVTLDLGRFLVIVLEQFLDVFLLLGHTALELADQVVLVAQLTLVAVVGTFQIGAVTAALLQGLLSAIQLPAQQHKHNITPSSNWLKFQSLFSGNENIKALVKPNQSQAKQMQTS